MSQVLQRSTLHVKVAECFCMLLLLLLLGMCCIWGSTFHGLVLCEMDQDFLCLVLKLLLKCPGCSSLTGWFWASGLSLFVHFYSRDLWAVNPLLLVPSYLQMAKRVQCAALPRKPRSKDGECWLEASPRRCCHTGLL